jgi:hypothetical protein
MVLMLEFFQLCWATMIEVVAVPLVTSIFCFKRYYLFIMSRVKSQKSRDTLSLLPAL